jgi:hypothetical protein
MNSCTFIAPNFHLRVDVSVLGLAIAAPSSVVRQPRPAMVGAAGSDFLGTG